MNWIKKLLQLFKTEEEYDDPIEIKTTQHRQNKHVEARVTYEYPKGNFRFPIIPDQKQDNVKTEKVQSRRTRTSQSNKNSNPKPTVTVKEKEPVRVKEKQPFRPTEIPSPVYGLGKPNQKEIIEFELPTTPITDTESIASAWKEAYKEVAPTNLQTEQVESKLRVVSNVNTHQKSTSLANQLIKEDPEHVIEKTVEQVVGKENLAGTINVGELKVHAETQVVNKDQNNSKSRMEEQAHRYDGMQNVQETKGLEAESTQHELEDSELQGIKVVEELNLPDRQGIEEAKEVNQFEPEVTEELEKLNHADSLRTEEEKETDFSEPVVTEGENETVKSELHITEEMTDDSALEVMEDAKEPNQFEPEVTEELEKLNHADSLRSKEEKQTVKELHVTEEVTYSVPQEIEEEKEINHIEPEVTKEAKEQNYLESQISQEEKATNPLESRVTEGENQTVKSESHVTDEVPEKSLSEPLDSQGNKKTTHNRPRRSNIPFNVMMFKKDRQRLAERSAKNGVEATPVKSIEPVNQQVPQGQNHQDILEEQQIQSKQHEHQSQPEQQITQQEDTEQLLGYTFPDLSFLHSPPAEQHDDSQWLLDQRNILDETLRNFKVGANVVNVTQGPAVTRFEVHPEPGVKVNKITNLSDDLKLSLAAKDIRIEAPIPGKNTIGIEVPNRKSKPVLLKEIIQSPEFTTNQSPLTVAMGLDISGNPIVTDLQKMPHGLIAGATGSGKSVCINAMLVSLLYKASPDEVKLLLIDPKMVELAPYNHIPHLVSPVITDVKAATASLKWAVEEMERRYELFAHTGVRDIGRYNEMVKKHDEKSGKLPYIVIIIDELADLMMVAPGEVEEYISRIAQKARACGIHLILATQRPSVDVITGLIKANIPTRIAFSVSSQVDSRTILDVSGAEKLLGKGDMLFLENGSSKPFRVQGNFVTDEEIEAIVNFVKAEMKPSYMFEQDELLKKASITNEEDELFLEACEFVLDQGGASTSSVQRRFRIGYNRAARLIDMMEEQGIISESRGSKPREVLIDEDDLAQLFEG